MKSQRYRREAPVNKNSRIAYIFLAVGLSIFAYCSNRPFPLPPTEKFDQEIKKNEKYYTGVWSQAHGGESEYLLADRTRVDVVTAEYAVEVEFADKWYQALGQSLHYALHTRKHPGIVMILKNAKDQKYLDRLVAVIKSYGLPITVWRMDRAGDSMVVYLGTYTSVP